MELDLDKPTDNFGALILTGWIGDTPPGSETAFLFLGSPGTHHTDTAAAMAKLADEVFGFDPAPMAVTEYPSPRARAVLVDDDGRTWIKVDLGSGVDATPIGRPIDYPDWIETARAQGKLMLAISYLKMHDEREDMDAFYDRSLAARKIVMGALSVDSQVDGGVLGPLGAGGFSDLVNMLAPAMATPGEQQRAVDMKPVVMTALLAARPGDYLSMADIGQATGIELEEAVALGMCLNQLHQDGKVTRGPDREGQGPTYRYKEKTL